MNILYIGPYKQTNEDGILSRCFIKDLSSKFSITTQPFFLDTTCIDKENYREFDEIRDTKYDILVQHLPIGHLAVTKQFRKNIAIPILNNRCLSPNEISTLNLFDKVLLDYDKSKILLDSNIISQIEVFDYDINQELKQDQKSFNFGIYNKMKKIYAIIDCRQDLEIASDLMLEFIASTTNQENICLVLFIYNTNQSDINKINEHIKNIYTSLKLQTLLNKVLLVTIENNLQFMAMAHKSADIFLNISSHYNSLQTRLASIYNNNILSIDEQHTTKNYLYNNQYNIYGYRYPSLKSYRSEFIEAIIENIFHQPKSSNTYSNISSLI